MRQWEEFTQKNSGSADVIRVSLNPRGIFTLNQKAVSLLDAPEAVVFMFDKANKLIGLKASSADVNHAYELKRQGESHSYLIRAKSFCNFYGIHIDKTIVFNDIQMEDGVIILQIDNITETERRTRTVKYPDNGHEPDQQGLAPKYSVLMRNKVLVDD